MRGLRKGVSVKVQQREKLRKLREGCPAEAKGRAHSQKEVWCRKVGAEKARQKEAKEAQKAKAAGAKFAILASSAKVYAEQAIEVAKALKAICLAASKPCSVMIT